MTIVLNTMPVSAVFQPEFPGLFFDVLGNGKTWIITLLGPLLALIPDFLYVNLKYIYFPSPSERLMRRLRKEGKLVQPSIN